MVNQNVGVYLCYQKQINMQNVIEHTNARLINWYSNVKKDFGVIGEGSATYNKETNEVVINYTEDGVKAMFKHYWDSEFKINTIFDIWATDANVETDKI